MSSIFIYLAGPITGCTLGGANDWRNAFSLRLAQINPNLVGVSPLRCEPLVGDRYGPQYEDKRFGTPQAIANKNLEDVRRADCVVAYIPASTTEETGHVSVGTLCELNWAVGLNKPRILISDVEYVSNNPVIRAITPWIFREETGFEDALDTIGGVFDVYTK